MLLKEIYDKKRYLFVEDELTWQEAVRMCCVPLQEDGTVEATYAEEIIACIEKYGPYIVLIPGVAIPHSTKSARGCHGTAIGFMHSAHPVHFAEGNPEKDATIFFTLCAVDSQAHLKNMTRLYSVLSNDNAIEMLKKATKPEDLIEIDAIVQDSQT